jgi:hypothetical protein
LTCETGCWHLHNLKTWGQLLAMEPKSGAVEKENRCNNGLVLFRNVSTAVQCSLLGHSAVAARLSPELWCTWFGNERQILELKPADIMRRSYTSRTSYIMCRCQSVCRSLHLLVLHVPSVAPHILFDRFLEASRR